MIGDIIEGLADEGLHLSIGPHVGRPGFYCTICKPGEHEECPECENFTPMGWEHAGHGLSVLSAINNAVALREANGLARSIDEFKEIS